MSETKQKLVDALKALVVEWEETLHEALAKSNCPPEFWAGLVQLEIAAQLAELNANISRQNEISKEWMKEEFGV